MARFLCIYLSAVCDARVVESACLAEDDGSAVFDMSVSHGANDQVGSDARAGVAAAALGGDGELLNADAFPLRTGDLLLQLLDEFDACLDSLLVAAGVVYPYASDGFVARRFGKLRRVYLLAAKADCEYCAYVWVADYILEDA